LGSVEKGKKKTKKGGAKNLRSGQTERMEVVNETGRAEGWMTNLARACTRGSKKKGDLVKKFLFIQ